MVARPLPSRRILHPWSWGLLLALLLWLGMAPVTPAAPLCRQVEGHEICLISIKRSAKYPWEYRVKVSIDGQQRPLERYDCRHQVRLRADGQTVSFATDGAVGPFLCQLVR